MTLVVVTDRWEVRLVEMRRHGSLKQASTPVYPWAMTSWFEMHREVIYAGLRLVLYLQVCVGTSVVFWLRGKRRPPLLCATDVPDRSSLGDGCPCHGWIQTGLW
jgi:hypothetical protein